MVAWAGDDLFAIVFDQPIIVGKGGFTVVVEKLANGDEIVSFHVRKDMCLACCYWELGNV